MKTTTNDLDYLSGCARFYDRLVDLAGRIDKRGDAEAALEAVQSIAHFAWHCHPGRYADGSIENLALRIGEQLDSLADSDNAGCGAAVASPRSRSARRRVLHVATTALPIGGHTRWIRDWIANDPGSDHSVLLTRQGATSVPGWLGQVVEQRGGTLFRLPDTASLVSQAHVVRTIAQAAADLVVLYHHPDDVVPVVAFAKGGGPPVALYNHADHVFWLGSSIADVVVDFRESGRRLSASRRFPARSELLPCPLPPVVGAVSREQARERLGMRADQLVLLSIGSAYKYVPTSDQNFFASAINLLERHPAAHLYLVGVPWDESQPHLRSARHERLHFVGRVEDPASYQAAADVYLEGFPFTSLTAMLEAVRFGVPAVAAFGESRGVLQSDDLAIDGLWRCEATEDEYLSQASRLIESAGAREELGGRLRDRVESVHTGAGWHDRICRLYDSLTRLDHAPRELPITECSTGSDDLALSRFHRRVTGPARVVRFLRGNMKHFSLAGVESACRVPLRCVGVERAWDRLMIRSSVMWDALLRKRNNLLARIDR